MYQVCVAPVCTALCPAVAPTRASLPRWLSDDEYTRVFETRPRQQHHSETSRITGVLGWPPKHLSVVCNNYRGTYSVEGNTVMDLTKHDVIVCSEFERRAERQGSRRWKVGHFFLHCVSL